MFIPLKRTFHHFRLHVCHHRAITEALVLRTTSTTRLTAVAKKDLSENFAKVIGHLHYWRSRNHCQKLTEHIKIILHPNFEKKRI